MAKKTTEKKWKPIEEMSAAQLRKFIPEHAAKAERFDKVPEDLGPGWKMAAKSTWAEVEQARARLDELES